MLVLATFFWGLSFPVIKTLLLLQARLLPGASEWFLSIYVLAPRFLLATLLVVAWRPRGWWRISGPEWKQGLIIGAFSSAGMLLQNDALHYTAASTSAFLTQFYVIIIPLWLMLRHRMVPGGKTWLCCALVLAGVAILGRFDWRELRLGRGEWETLLCSVFFTGQILWLAKGEFAGNRAEKVTLVMFAVQTVVFVISAVVMAPSAEALVVPFGSGAWLGLTAMLAVFCTVGAYTLMNAWQPKIGATEAGLIYCVEPIFGSIMACFLPALFSAWALVEYPNETITWTLLVGGGLITLANALLQVPDKVKK